VIELFRLLFPRRQDRPWAGIGHCPRCGEYDGPRRSLLRRSVDEFDLGEYRGRPHTLFYDAASDLISVTCWRCGAKWTMLPLTRGPLPEVPAT